MFLKPVCLSILAALPGIAAQLPDKASAQPAKTLPAADLQLDQILERNYQARGGLEKLKALKSFRMLMNLDVKGVGYPMTILARRPMCFRAELNISGAVVIQAFDGTIGWTLNPLSNNKYSRLMGKAEMIQIENQADMDGPLVDWKEKGHTIEVLGREKLPEGEAIKLKMIIRGGQEFISYLDAKTYLEIKQVTTRTINGQKVEGESTYGDYRKVGDLVLPFRMESGPKGSEDRQVITVKSIALNPEVTDDSFKEPPKGGEPEKPAAAPLPDQRLNDGDAPRGELAVPQVSKSLN